MLDFEKWDVRNRFSIREAAYLWYEIDFDDPNEKISPEAKAKIDEIHRRLEHAFRPEISEHRAKNFQAHPDKSLARAFILSPPFTVNREELWTIAEKWGERPAFLFPEDREIPERRKRDLPRNRFIKKGDTWEISYAEVETSVNDLKGIGDIAYLLSHPFHGVEAVDLLGRLDEPLDATPLNEMVQEQLGEEGLSRAPLGIRARIAFSSEGEKRKYLKGLSEVEAEIAEAKRIEDPLLLKELESQRADLMNDLSKKARPAESEEKARKAIKKRIKVAMHKIRKQHPDLGDHLAKYINCGKMCTYTPDPPTSWEIIS